MLKGSNLITGESLLCTAEYERVVDEVSMLSICICIGSSMRSGHIFLENKNRII